ncbi:BTAD domain-containing putative transcriptional regulator [Micromonospora sp. NPDC023737]|uniref:AfsR/SARP family transcriptional regulator n=1 Tax=unclassified Micromonospora TaxID=2617518 RepID=UPI0033FDEB1B
MLEVDLLGPVEVRERGNTVSLSPLERNLVVILALAKGTVVSTARIIDCMWGEQPPASPRSRVQGLVSSLRRKVGTALLTRHPGYLLDPAACLVDVDRAQELARQSRLAESPGEIARWLREALTVWRGEALDGVDAPGVDVDRARLDELRIALVEERFAAELDAGNHTEVVGEIGAAVAEHPLRERLAGQLMAALYRCHRQADALKAYQALRDRLAEELGSDPCAELRNLHASILRGEDTYSPSAAEHPRRGELKPAQLPPSVGHFTGRSRELSALTRRVQTEYDEPQVLLVSGAGGLGKTALVVRWAHLNAARFPDGQIFLDLHGGHTAPEDALAAVLAALGTARDKVPLTMDGRAALYRTLLSGRQMLIIADDADSVEQVLPLVPPQPSSTLVVISRRRLPALAAHHAVHALPLGPLSARDAYDLLGRIVGAQRLADPALARVITWCGGWPLAIRSVAALLAARPGQSVSSFADELWEQGDGLLLDGDQRSVHTALAGAYRMLSPAAAHLFVRLGLTGQPSFRLCRTAAGSQLSQTRRLFDELVAADLIVESGSDCYRFHDVVHRFARRCGEELNAWWIPIESVADLQRSL